MTNKTNSAQRVTKRGIDLLDDPLLNKGTAFREDERDAFGVRGLVPPHVETLEDQCARAKIALDEVDVPIQKYLRLRQMQDDNEVLFYKLISEHLTEILPLIYTPTVGEGCEEFSRHWEHPRGLFLSPPDQSKLDDIFADPRFDAVEVIVVSDGERILGLGDQGANGMGIPIGKLSLYTACGGIDPNKTLPILLDTGTDNEDRRNDPRYIGWRHARVRGEEYDDFVEAFVTAVKKRWPHVLLQWEDFARGNALRLLERYKDHLCTFNDDVQGTAAVAAGTLLAASKAKGEGLGDQVVVIFGAGSAGCGIGRLILRLMQDEGLSEAEARARFYAMDANGLVLDDADLQDFQKPFARSRDDIADWKCADKDRIDLIDVLRNIKATVLLGTSGQAGAFDQSCITEMASKVERPVILPLSNPVSKSEARPQDIVDWTDGKAMIGTGSPFDPVKIGGKSYTVDQTNNAYVFPGVGLGVLAARATRVSEQMFVAAAKALAQTAKTSTEGPGHMLPPTSELRRVAVEIAKAVARSAVAEGLAEAQAVGGAALDDEVEARMWHPVYRDFKAE
ncbi:NAD-dependent malic enzyme [Stappia sp. BW2]|uniref:NAD-dependent malic enzyme n=1 Tax=Stappia sp. BW2 TaxID=2592622 RepID=UPI0011DE6339|nr:NAD-dependent malic enzyme [Stappia sp. BW2]TYC64067.1 NAD-dependent malic enzyme [Stappia sp. BW2]